AAGSPGVLSGNTVQAPVHVPVNVCGNTVDVVGLLNPSVGNACANQDGPAPDGYGDSGHTGPGGQGGSHAGGHATGSPGVASGNHVQAPVHIPVNVCGNSVDVIGAGNATAGNDCGNGGSGHETPGHPGDPGTPGEPGSPGQPERPDEPGTPDSPDTPGDRTPEGNRPDAHFVTQPQAGAQLARTGSELPMGFALPAGAGALLAGAVLYRKARAAA
ncbi:chaplin family protein, partial [Streptomyces sp. G35A]